MSTKTNFKRVALVAVASLGLGVLTSIAPASAVVIVADDVALTVAAATVDTFGTCAAGTNTTTQVAATPQVMTLGAHQTFTISNNADAVLTITGPAKWIGKRVSDGALNYTNPTQTATYTVNGDQKVATIGATGAYVLEVTGAGSIIVTAAASAAAPTALNTWYLLGATACSNSVSVANSFVQVTNAVGNVMTQANINTLNSSQYDNAVATGGSAAGLDTSSDVITTFANDGVAYIAVSAKDAYTYALAGTNLLMIQCDNGAKVNSTIYPYYSDSSFAASTTTANIPVRQATSGVSMVTTCAVSVNGVALASKKITFAGDVATITIAASRNGDVDNGTDSRFSYVYKDSAGNALTAALPSLTASTASASTTSISAYSSSTFYNSSVAYAGAKGAGSNPLYKTSGYSVFNCLDYGTTSISVYAYNAAGTKITSNVLPVICGGAIDTYTVAFDKAKYSQGDVATLTITAKSAGGTPTGYAVTPGAGFSVAMPGMTAVTAPTTADTESVARAGVWTYTYTVNAGAEGNYNGAVKIAVASTSAQYNKAVTVPYSIGSAGGVSNADVLKAIVSLIASINKQIAALQKALLKK